MLEERIEFGIEGFRRGGIVLTRRDILEMFARAPESAGDLLPLIQADLAEMIQADLALEAISFHSCRQSVRKRRGTITPISRISHRYGLARNV